MNFRALTVIHLQWRTERRAPALRGSSAYFRAELELCAPSPASDSGSSCVRFLLPGIAFHGGAELIHNNSFGQWPGINPNHGHGFIAFVAEIMDAPARLKG